MGKRKLLTNATSSAFPFLEKKREKREEKGFKRIVPFPKKHDLVHISKCKFRLSAISPLVYKAYIKYSFKMKFSAVQWAHVISKCIEVNLHLNH